MDSTAPAPVPSRIYLDHLTTTPLHPEVRDAMAPFFEGAFGSPGSLHQEGRHARRAIDRAREQVAAWLGASSAEEIIFTSGATEAANLAVKGAALAGRRRTGHLVLSQIEHPAVIQSVELLESLGYAATRVGVDDAGRVPPDAVRTAMTDQTVLVCLHQANHDLGTVQALEAIGAATADRGIPLFVDASASGGWLPLNVSAAPIDLVSLAPHRFYGPKGVGILWKHRRTRLTPWIQGGVQEHGLRAGTENVAAIVGAGAAADLARRERSARAATVSARQRLLWEELRRQVPALHLNGPEPGPERLMTQLNVSPEGVEGEGVALALDLQGVALHSGAACVTRSLRLPPALAAIGRSPALARASVILSPGADTTEAEVRAAVDRFARVVSRLREDSPSPWRPPGGAGSSAQER